MPFTLHVDFDEIDGTAATRTKSVTVYPNTQVTGPGLEAIGPPVGPPRAAGTAAA